MQYYNPIQVFVIVFVRSHFTGLLSSYSRQGDPVRYHLGRSGYRCLYHPDLWNDLCLLSLPTINMSQFLQQGNMSPP